MIKIKHLLLTGGTMNIPISLNTSFDLVDNSELVDDFIEIERNKAINSIKNMERMRYKPDGFLPVLDVWFFDCNSTNTTPITSRFGRDDYSLAGFSDQTKKGFLKSFYTFDFYNSKNRRTQEKILTIIVPIIPSRPVSPTSLTPRNYVFNENEEGHFLYFSKTLDLPKNIFMKTTLFNAETGKKIAFYDAFVVGGISNMPNIRYNDKLLYTQYVLKDGFKYDIINAHSFTINGQPGRNIQLIEARSDLLKTI